MTNFFFSVSSSSECEKALWDEIHGCVKYTGISLSEVMEMPVYLRKNWIETHNYMEKLEQQQHEDSAKRNTRTADDTTNNYL